MGVAKSQFKVMIDAYPETAAEAAAKHLKARHAVSTDMYHLVDDPGIADLILICAIGNEVDDEQYIERTLVNPLIDQFPDKSFTICYRDTPVVFNRGVYESAEKYLLNRGRVTPGSYGLSGTFNPEVAVPGSGSGKDLLFSFIGRMSHPCRNELLKQIFVRKDIHVEDSSNFQYWNSPVDLKAARERHYAGILARSKFCLCPRGAGAGSIRLFEALRAGVAPVIISDNWIGPNDPKWKAFSITVGEHDLGRLEAIVTARENEFTEMGRQARACWERDFRDEAYFRYIVRGCVQMQQRQLIPESFYWRSRWALKRYRKHTRLPRIF